MEMKFTIEQVRLKLFNDIKKDYTECTLEEDKLIIVNGSIEVCIPLNIINSECQSAKEYKKVLLGYKGTINQVMNEGKFEINYHQVYPMVRNKDFAIEDRIKFHRKQCFMDLDMLLVSDFKEMIRYLSVDDIKDSERIYEAAMFNINKITNVLSKLNPELEIYTTKFNNDYNCSMVYNHNFRKQIRRIFPQNYLIAIPSGSTILVAMDNPVYIEILAQLILTDNDPNIVSTRIYRYRFSDGEYEYAN